MYVHHQGSLGSRLSHAANLLVSMCRQDQARAVAAQRRQARERVYDMYREDRRAQTLALRCLIHPLLVTVVFQSGLHNCIGAGTTAQRAIVCGHSVQRERQISMCRRQWLVEQSRNWIAADRLEERIEWALSNPQPLGSADQTLTIAELQPQQQDPAS